MKKIVLSLVIFFIIMGIVITAGIVYLMRGQKEVLSETIEPIIFSEIADGIYIGHYDNYRWSNELKVTVENGVIVSIEIISDHRLPNDVTSALLFDTVKASETLDVDTVAGGTVSSIAYLKAIENALKS